MGASIDRNQHAVLYFLGAFQRDDLDVCEAPRCRSAATFAVAYIRLGHGLLVLELCECRSGVAS